MTTKRVRRTVVPKIVLSQVELEALIDSAAKKGAKEALESVGLHDESAGGDIRDLRSLIDGWRTVKKTALRSTVQVFTIAILGLLSIGLTWKLFTRE